MKLTPQQEQRIAAYLREVSAYLGAREPDGGRRQALDQVKSRIVRRLYSSADTAATDEQVEAALRESGSPDTVAERLAGKGLAVSASPLAVTGRVWLGVCDALSRWAGVSPRIVRIVAVLIGLIPPLFPFLMVAYLAGYFAMYYGYDDDSVLRIEKVTLAKAVAVPVGILLLLNAGARLLLMLIVHLWEQFARQPFQLEYRWNWIEVEGGTFFVWALLILVPPAILSGLPVPKDWAATLRKTVHAGAALYAMLLSVGVAYVIVGILLKLAELFGGSASWGQLFGNV